MFACKELMKTLDKLLLTFSFAAVFWACSDSDGKNFVGGASGDAGVYAVTDREVAGVTQKGPFVTGSAVTVQELDGITLKQTGKSFKGTIKSDKGDFAIKDINLESQYAILEASGYYRDEISGKKSSGTVTLRALTDLSNRKTVNINLLTHLEYERVMYLVTEKKMPIADAKAQAEKEILASFGIDGDYAESEDLNIFESGDGNAALLAVSVLMQSDVDVAGLTERMGEFSIALAEGGSWDDADTKTAIADWACDVDLKGTIANVRKNVENWKYADSVPAFEKFVTNFWWNNYGLGVCNEKRENETKRNVNKLSKLYDEYFVCEKGRWVIPNDGKSSSSSKDGGSEAEKSSSSSKVPEPAEGSSSSIVSSSSSSSSIYNPFVDPNPIGIPDSVPLPIEVQVFDTTYRFQSYAKLGDGKQEVWFLNARTYSTGDAEERRDSVATNLVNILGEKGFSYDGIEIAETHEKGFSDTSYVYSLKKDGVVYKVLIRKIKDGYKELPIIIIWLGFEVKVVVLKDGFKELPVNAPRSSSSSVVFSSSAMSSSSSLYDPFVRSSSSNPLDTIPPIPSDIDFFDSVYSFMGYRSFGEEQQKVWFLMVNNPTGSRLIRDSIASALVKTMGDKGFVFEGAVENDSLNKDYNDSLSYVYSLKKENIVYRISMTKIITSWNQFQGNMYSFTVKVVELKDGFEEQPTTDYNSMRFIMEFPDEIAFMQDFASSQLRTDYNDDSLMNEWKIRHNTDSVKVSSTVYDYKAELGRKKEAEDTLALFRDALLENGFTFVKSDSLGRDDTGDSLIPRSIYEKVTSIARYEVVVGFGIDKYYNYTYMIMNNAYLYIYGYTVTVRIFYKQKPERKKS